MPRLTVDIDGRILRQLRLLREQRSQPLGRLVSDLLTEALARHGAVAGRPVPFRWVSRSMRARVDLSDKRAVYAALMGDPRRRSG
jgi:hypothetical protein